MSITGSFTGSFKGDGSQLTGVGGDPFPYTGSAIISGSLIITGSLNVSNTITAGCIIETSAFRYKDNILSLSSSLDKVKQLKPVTFDWKHSGKNDIGFIAEEVNEILPNLIQYNGEGEVEGMNYSKITSLLVAAIQEQQAQINELQTKINKLDIN